VALATEREGIIAEIREAVAEWRRLAYAVARAGDAPSL